MKQIALGYWFWIPVMVLFAALMIGGRRKKAKPDTSIADS
jgi:hypothetical protein